MLFLTLVFFYVHFDIFYVSNLKTYISKLRTHVFKLETYVSNLETTFTTTKSLNFYTNHKLSKSRYLHLILLNNKEKVCVIRQLIVPL